jgi:hypothetical protein
VNERIAASLLVRISLLHLFAIFQIAYMVPLNGAGFLNGVLCFAELEVIPGIWDRLLVLVYIAPALCIDSLGLG